LGEDVGYEHALPLGANCLDQRGISDCLGWNLYGFGAPKSGVIIR
jgi:hypothetical protein